MNNNTKFISIGMEKNIRNELYNCESCIFVAPFFSKYINGLIHSAFESNSNLKNVKIITTTYDKEAKSINFELLENLKNIYGSKIEIFIELVEEDAKRLHSKIYLFNRQNQESTMFIGSSNFSKTGFITGKESNILLNEKKYVDLYSEVREYINDLTNDDTFVNIFDPRIDKYKEIQTKTALINKQRNQQVLEIIKEYSETKNLNLRKYQIKAIKKISDEFNNGIKEHFVVMATGTGKTIVASSYINEIQKRIDKLPTVFFIVNNKEILEQAKSTFVKYCGYKEDEIASFYDGQNSYDLKNKKVFFATMSSLKNKLDLFKDIHIHLTIFDEAHHFDIEDSQMFSKVFLFFKDISKEILGLTATPLRTNGNDVSVLFNGRYTYSLPLYKAIDNGYLCPLNYYFIGDDSVDNIDINIEKDTKELAKILSNEKRNELLLDTIQKYIGKKTDDVSSVIFCVNIEHANSVCKFLKENDIKVEALSSEVNKSDRKEIINKFKNQEINYLCVVDIFNEGIDVPNINNIFFLRPTASKLIFLQQLGRGLRNTLDKKLCVYDFINNINIKNNKNYNPFSNILELSDGLNISTESIMNNNADDYLPDNCNLFLNKMAAKNLKAILKKMSDNSIAWSKLLKDMQTKKEFEFENYRHFLNNNYLEDISYFYTKSKTFIKNNDVEEKDFSKMLYNFSIINSRQLFEGFLNIIETKQKSNNLFVNNLFIKSIFISKKFIIDSEIKLKKFIEENDTFVKELKYLIKFKIEETLLINKPLNKLEDLHGVYLNRKLIDSLFVNDIFSDRRINASMTGVETWNKNRGNFYIITSEENDMEYANRYSKDKNEINWYAPNNWRILDKKPLQIDFEKQKNNKHFFINYNVNKHLSKLKELDKKVYEFVGTFNGPAEPHAVSENKQQIAYKFKFDV